MRNIYQIFGKVLFTINDPLPILPGNEQDLDHKNIVNTYLFDQVCKVHDIVSFGDQYSNAEKLWHLSFRHFCLKLVSWMITTLIPNLCQNFVKTLKKFNWDTSFRQKCLKLRYHDFNSKLETWLWTLDSDNLWTWTSNSKMKTQESLEQIKY